MYGLRDTIPFHVQLSGRLSSVKSFLMVPRSDNPALELDTSDGRSLQLSSHSGPIVRVYLLRHVSIETRGCKTSRNTIIAEGRLREIPPAHSHCESEDAMHLDWEGEVRCGHDICVGGFAASNVVVKVRYKQTLSMPDLHCFLVLGFHWDWNKPPRTRTRGIPISGTSNERADQAGD